MGSDSGRVTFMPLNRLTPPNANLAETDDSSPLMNHLKIYNAAHKKAFQQIFGRTLLCSNLEVATTNARESGVNCVTLQGDQVNRKGAMTGGYHDVRYSRLACIKEIRKLRAESTELRTQLESVRTALQRE